MRLWQRVALARQVIELLDVSGQEQAMGLWDGHRWSPKTICGGPFILVRNGQVRSLGRHYRHLSDYGPQKRRDGEAPMNSFGFFVGGYLLQEFAYCKSTALDVYFI